MRECYHGAHGIDVTRANVLGVLSLIFWAIVTVVTVKYHLYVLRADNRGEGGILALMALIPPRLRGRAEHWLLTGLGLFGAALLYGDGMITPAISVLSAVEGLGVATPFFDPYVVPITIGILIVLFLFQRRGTASVGAVFGPVMLLWFGTLAVLGLLWIVREPGVLAAVNPAYAVTFFLHNGVKGFLVLGAVFLVATGGEALYADMGHFGELPIQIDWFSLVGPSLLLNYFGQGAMLLREPQASFNPFYHLAPSWALYPLVILATLATVRISRSPWTTVRRPRSMVRSGKRRTSDAVRSPRRSCARTRASSSWIEKGFVHSRRPPGRGRGLVALTLADGEHEDRRAVDLPHARDEGEAVHPRHGEVGDHHVRTMLLEKLQPLLAVHGRDRVVAGQGELADETLADRRVVEQGQGPAVGLRQAYRGANGRPATARVRGP